MKKLFFAFFLLFSISFDASAMKLYIANYDCNEQDCILGFDLPNGQKQKRLIKSETMENFSIEADEGIIKPYIVKENINFPLVIYDKNQEKTISSISLEHFIYCFVITDINNLLANTDS